MFGEAGEDVDVVGGGVDGEGFEGHFGHEVGGALVDELLEFAGEDGLVVVGFPDEVEVEFDGVLAHGDSPLWSMWGGLGSLS